MEENKTTEAGKDTLQEAKKTVQEFNSFNDKLFGNTEKKITLVARILFWVGSIASIICAFAFGIYSYGSGYYRETVFIGAIFWPFLLGGPSVFYVSSLMMHGFAKVIEKLDIISKK